MTTQTKDLADHPLKLTVDMLATRVQRAEQLQAEARAALEEVREEKFEMRKTPFGNDQRVDANYWERAKRRRELGQSTKTLNKLRAKLIQAQAAWDERNQEENIRSRGNRLDRQISSTFGSAIFQLNGALTGLGDLRWVLVDAQLPTDEIEPVSVKIEDAKAAIHLAIDQYRDLILKHQDALLPPQARPR